MIRKSAEIVEGGFAPKVFGGVNLPLSHSIHLYFISWFVDHTPWITNTQAAGLPAIIVIMHGLTWASVSRV
jgi:hypothetical protein